MGARVLVHLSELGEGYTRLPIAIGRQNRMLVAVGRGRGGRGTWGGGGRVTLRPGRGF